LRTRTLLIVLSVSILLQVVFVQYISAKWFRPDLPLLVILYFSARRGSFYGVIAGFFAGLIIDAFSVGFFGLSCMAYSMAGFLVGKLFYFELPLPLSRWMLASITGIALHGLIFAYFYSLHDSPAFTTLLLIHVFPAVAYTWVLGMLWAISPAYDRRSKIKI